MTVIVHYIHCMIFMDYTKTLNYNLSLGSHLFMLKKLLTDRFIINLNEEKILYILFRSNSY